MILKSLSVSMVTLLTAQQIASIQDFILISQRHNYYQLSFVLVYFLILDKERCHHAGARDHTKRYINHNRNDVAKTCVFLLFHVHIEFQLDLSSEK